LGAAACLKAGEAYVGLGEASAVPSFERGVLKLEYTGGDLCPDRIRRKSAVIRFQCDKDIVVRSDRRLGSAARLEHEYS